MYDKKTDKMAESGYMENSMKERIVQIMEAEGLTPAKFAERIGIQRAAMSHIMNERNKPSADVLIKTLAQFPEINPDWLLQGRGSMKRNVSVNAIQKESDLFTNVSNARPKETKSMELNTDTSVSAKSSFSSRTSRSVPKETFVTSLHSNKKIKQILIFFSDNTFESFRPEIQD
jgi:transcriptional regulator with XRE-family HTH domain